MATTLQQAVDESYAVAREKGWWDSPTSVPEKLALIHSEVSEVLEEFRNNKAMPDVYYGLNGKPEGIPVELADILIRVFDICGRYRIDIENAYQLKTTYNRSREYRHGGKRA